ncbi:hypothetical protein O6H91_12G101500 [Diphasiastrum complanatum]|uniref:Uncharacterized protein n=1 Tax=Diphasiastrum complanatum TaxID=34168 RepID=A0ACC2C5E3_DIPCM|nr:hypothetical protein O6H91_12G101500 [Diphasiastrum complanatum]
MAAAMLQLHKYSFVDCSPSSSPLRIDHHSCLPSSCWENRSCCCITSFRRRARRRATVAWTKTFRHNKLFLSSLSNSDAAAATTPSSSSPNLVPEQSPNVVELEFYGPDGNNEEPQKIVLESGTKVLRNIMLDNKLELYDLYGKLMNCGGGGSCGTCIVEILEGNDLLSKRTDSENHYLKKKPKSWRLACQTIVGDKINGGKVILTNKENY